MTTKRNTRTTIAAGALAFTLLAGGITPAATVHAASSAISFSDVSSGHWAEKHISKLALQGIITGYNGLFRPGDSVTRQEAVLMALRFKGLDGEVKTDDVIAYPSSFVVSNFYKAYIALAFDQNLLDREDEYALAASEPDKDWGTAPASREWVTKLLVRAIGEDDTAESMALTPSSFGDAGSIDGEYVGYINAAVSLQLVNGVSATKFDPKANVNRASLATMFSRAERLYPFNYEGQLNGIVTGIDSSSITIYAGGEETTYAIDADTLFYRYDSETRAAIGDIKPYTDVMVIAQSGSALYIEAQGDEQHVETYEAELDRVLESDNLIYVWVDDKPVEVYYGDNLIVKNAKGETVSLDSIGRDSVIRITQDTFRSEPVAVEIEVETQAEKSAEGTFYSTDGELITLMVNGSPVTYVLDGEVEVEIDGVDGATLDDLLKGQDEVLLTMDDDGKVTKAEVTNRDVEEVTGASVTNYDSGSSLLTLVASNGTTPYALFISDNTKIRNDGKNISISDADSLLREGRIVSFTYTGSSIISLELLTGYTGTISAIDKSGQELTLKLDNGTSATVPYSSPTVEIADNDDADVGDLAVGDKVTVKLTSSQNRAATIKVHKNVQYDIVNVIEASGIVQLKSEGEDAFNLNVNSLDMYDEEGGEAAVYSFEPGDVVTVSYEGSTAQSLAEVPVTLGEITAASSGSLTVETSSGDDVVVPFDKASDKLYVDGNSASAIAASLTGKYAAVLTDEQDNTTIYVSSGEKRNFIKYDNATGQLITLLTSSGNNNYYFYVRDDTELSGSGGTFDVSSLAYGQEITVYSFRNTAIAVIKS